jgi:nucleoside-diphosphate-sugar epimerase
LGHTGFLGSNLIETLDAESFAATVLHHSLEQGDLTSSSCVDLLAGNFHSDMILFILASIKRQMGESFHTFEANMRISSNICKALAKTPVSRVVFISSAAVYGEDIAYDVITEKTPPNPRTFYGLAKYNSEWMLRKAVEEGGANSLCIIRPPTIYGPQDTSLSYGPPLFLDRAIKGETITLWGDGSELREFVFVKDAALGISRLAQSNFNGPVNLAAGQSYTFEDVLDAVEHVTGKKIAVESRQRSKEKVDHRFNNALLRSLVPDLTFTTLLSGIQSLFENKKSAEQKSSQEEPR